jgi:prepilin signal peptidase PulO-like enzyme (type II secretory pathway)
MDSLAVYWLCVFVLFLVGVSIGSFMNVYVYRAPKMLLEEDYPHTLSKPNSFCPHCNSAIHWKYLLPVIGYLLSKRECTQCHKSISIHYPLVELAYGIIPVLNYFIFGWSIDFVVVTVLLFSVYPIVAIDFKHHLLLDTTTYPLLWIALLLSALNFSMVSPSMAIIGALAGYLFLSIPIYSFKLLRGFDGMGMGDAKLMGAMGAFFGWQAIPFIMIIASIFGIAIYLFEVKRSGNKNPYFAFGPAIILAVLLYELKLIMV